MSAIIQRRANGAEIRMAGVIRETGISVRPAEGRLWVDERQSWMTESLKEVRP
jgi:hypothetical protein